MRALVTGGAGFIGSHLVDYLLSLGHKVDVIDNLTTGSPMNLRTDSGNLWFVESSVRNAHQTGLLENLVDRADVIYHLAAIVGVERVMSQPLATIEENIDATARILTMAAKYTKRILITSSSEVYGHRKDGLLREDADLLVRPHVRWGYAAAKLVDEFTAMAHHATSALPVTVVRLFNTIGPRQVGTYGMVVPRFIRQAQSGETLTIYGNGYQRRSFTWVGDVVRCMTALGGSADAIGKIVNIGSDQETSINDLARMICVMTGNRSGIQYTSMEFEDIQSRRPDLTLLESLIHFRPAITLDQMLQNLIPRAARHAL